MWASTAFTTEGTEFFLFFLCGLSTLRGEPPFSPSYSLLYILPPTQAKFVRLSSIDQDHKRQQPVGRDDFARVRYQYTGGASPIQIEGNIQV
jgi:hypothetical protein